MISPPYADLRRMHDYAEALLEGRSGPLSGEQKELVRIMYDHCREVSAQIDMMLNLMHDDPSPGQRQMLRRDLDSLLLTITHYAEFVHTGAAGPVTPAQGLASQTVRTLAQRLRTWATAVFEPEVAYSAARRHN